MCGTPTGSAPEILDLVLPRGERVPLDAPLSMGRSLGNEIQLTDPTVSREHARLRPTASGYLIEDAGSSYGTQLDGRPLSAPKPLRDGSLITVGDVEVSVERRANSSEAGRTICVPVGASLVVPVAGKSHLDAIGAEVGERPRLRSGYALKRLDASEGEHRFVLKDLRTNRFIKLREPEAELVQLIDGQRSLIELIGEAERLCGEDGAARLARLLADLAEHQLIAGVDDDEPESAQQGLLARLAQPRERVLPHATRLIARTYERGGYLLYTRPARLLVGALAAVGLAAFIVLIARRYGTPFVVARRVGLGALVFLVGRFVVVAAHELAHGLTLESYGRKVGRVGLKWLLVFPYAFVDTSEAWFEPRRRRIAVSLAGPLSDLALGGAFAIACLGAPAGSIRDILFQLAFAGYVGALFNLNPLLERDGYHVLVDVARQPSLRRRSREALSDLLSGRGGRVQDSGMLVRYALISFAWSVLTVAFAIGLSTRYYDTLVALAPAGLVWTLLACFYLALVLPLVVQLLRPLLQRRRTPAASSEAVVGG